MRLWCRWLEDLKKLRDLRFVVPRCLIPNSEEALQVHVFCDASEGAYGAVAYLKFSFGVSFLMSKSKLAPMKFLSVPRLELCAAVLAVKMSITLKQELPLEVPIYFWSDSQVVLRYITNTSRRFKTFVANRVGFILESTTPQEWRYVPTGVNPADPVSRGLMADELISCDLFRQGPEFLKQNESGWPEQPALGTPDLQNDPEVKEECSVTCLIDAAQTAEPPTERLIKHFSSFFHLKRAASWLLKFGDWLRNRRKGRTENPSSNLQVSDLLSVERALVRYVQRQHFDLDIEGLLKGSVSKQSRIRKLNPTIDEDGFLVVRGRLKHSSLPRSANQPRILPKDHSLSLLLAHEAHSSLAMHAGRETSTFRLREHYWVIGARTLMKKVIRNCFVCKRFRNPLMQQRMAELPRDRVTADQPPFYSTGVDCFGPFMVKRGRSLEKRYGCIFSCNASRAVHLEVLASMDADSFLSALFRFMSRRGTPHIIRSDNGTNFVGAQRELATVFRNSQRIRSEMMARGIDWRFNTPASPHMGGVWERLIGSVKTALEMIMASKVRRSLDDEHLSTLFCIVEDLINRRPLTPLPDSPDELRPLTPMDLIRPFSEPLDIGLFDEKDQFKRRWKQVQFLVQCFWERWTQEYLPSLLVRKRWLEKQECCRVGDLVLVSDETRTRGEWPLALIIETFPGKDGLVRSVRLKTSSGELSRPVHKLCLLEGVL